jgi:hypothetical protein
MAAGEDAMGEDRKQKIATVLAAEIKRQGALTPRLDLMKLAGAVDAVLESPASSDEGKTPDELNASNDD